MLDELKSRRFHSLLAECEQIVGEELSRNIPMAIGLDLYMAQCAGESRRFDELLESVAAAPTTFKRYVKILEARGVIERSSHAISGDSLLRLTKKAQAQFHSAFLNEDN